ncbi:30S ribosomal protein S9 [Patescibacteria group bacterium AH-259-L07]|nr:30S ribosomal protein S9 [Patescibacteria group bacterium AH-259-L07]
MQFFNSGKGEIFINNRSIKDYFPVFELQKSVTSPLVLLSQDKKFTFRIRVHGSGIRGQAEAVRLGIARALSEFNQEWRKPLKTAGFLRRDPRN